MIEPTGELRVRMIRPDGESPYKAHADLIGGDIIEITRELLINADNAELTPLGDGRYIIDKYLLTPVSIYDNMNCSILFKVTKDEL